LVVLWQGEPLAWFDRRSHHLVTFPGTALRGAWAEALGSLVKDGRVRSLEVRKVDGEPLDGSSPVAAHLRHAGFVDSYRGVVLRSS
jgi:ATP-dependent Lhr-like helicase